LLREMEGAKTVSVGAVYVPNSYLIHLGTEDFERFEGLIPTLQDEFGSLLVRSAAERRWHFPGPLVVDFAEDPELASGRFEVRAEHDAEAVAPAPAETHTRDVLRLTGSQPPREWVLGSGRMVMGRLPTCEISLNDANASRQHAELVKREDGWWIVDLDSTNGTFLNGSLVKERRLGPGDRIQIGSSKLEFATEQAQPGPPKAPPAAVPEPTQVVSNPLNAD
jgi:FHA domain/FhaA, N-terminal domain